MQKLSKSATSQQAEVHSVALTERALAPGMFSTIDTAHNSKSMNCCSNGRQTVAVVVAAAVVVLVVVLQ